MASEAFEKLQSQLARVIDGLPGSGDSALRVHQEHNMLCAAALEAAALLLVHDLSCMLDDDCDCGFDRRRDIAIELVCDAAARARELAAEMVAADPRLLNALEWADRRAGGSDEALPDGLLDFPAPASATEHPASPEIG